MRGSGRRIARMNAYSSMKNTDAIDGEAKGISIAKELSLIHI